MSELGLFLIDDGENHWIAAMSAEHAISFHVDNVGFDEEDAEEVEFVRQLPGDEVMCIGLPDGYHEKNRDDYPHEPFKDTDGRWWAEATVAEWLGKVSDPPEYVATSVF